MDLAHAVASATSPDVAPRLPTRRVLGVQLPVSLNATCRQQLRGRVLRRARTMGSVSRVLMRAPDWTVLLPVPADGDQTTMDAVTLIREEHPQTPLIGVFVPTLSSPRWLLPFGAVGVRAVVHFRGEASDRALEVALTQVERDWVAEYAWRQARTCLRESLDVWFEPILKAAVHLAHAPLTTGELAHRLGVHERTLRKQCMAHDVVSPQWIVGWARLLIAGAYLDTSSAHAVAPVATLLGFSSASALHAQLRRYIGRKVVGAATTHGRVLEIVIHSLRQALEAAPPSQCPSCAPVSSEHPDERE